MNIIFILSGLKEIYPLLIFYCPKQIFITPAMFIRNL